MIFMITGTREMVLKLLGSDGLPDLKMGYTIVFPGVRNVGTGDSDVYDV